MSMSGRATGPGELLWGANCVGEALRAGRRRMYELLWAPEKRSRRQVAIIEAARWRGLPLRHLFRSDTKTKKGYNFWGCSNYPACPATFADAEGVPGDRQDTRSKPAASGFSCPKCGKDLVRRTGTSKTGKPYDFFGCTGFRQGCKDTFNPKADNNPDFEGRQGK